MASTPLDMEKEIVWGEKETTPLLLKQQEEEEEEEEKQLLLQQPPRLQRISGRQSSFVTVLALWNTMIATTVLSMPWAVKEAGLLCGVLCLIVVAAIMGYTCYLVLHSVDGIAEGQRLEFHDVCRRYLGRWAKVLAMTGSLLSLMGGMVVYCLLVTNFLFHIGNFVYDHVHNINGSGFNSSSEQYGYAVCDGAAVMGEGSARSNGNIGNMSNIISNIISNNGSSFHQWWDRTSTIPLYLLVLLFPLLHFKQATVFTVMNSVGMLSLVYLVVFVAVKASGWGLNLDPHTAPADRDLYTSHYAPQFRWSFPALTGVASLGYFIQSSVLSIVRNQRHPQNNTRDLLLAYVMVAITYIYVGGAFYLSFPLNKDCIADNLLENVASGDVLGLAGRVGLCVQLGCIFPQLAYITRLQLFTAFFASPWPSVYHVVILNVLIVAICLLFAVYLPHIGRILSFVGALSGFYYAVGLPCLVRCVVLHREGRLTACRLALHVLLPVLGLLNFLAQFFLVH